MRGIKIDGDRLRALREERIMLIANLADASGIHRNTISRLERGIGTATPQTINALADALGIRPNTLVYGAKDTRRPVRGLPRTIGS
jgi:transcriptional regulator with XRE-family HTH domain